MYRVTVLTLLMWTSNAEDITVKSGDDVPLPCQGPRDANITLLEWNRSDLKTDDYVFFLRGDQPNESFQDPSFRGRVQLMDPQIKNGDVSVILKNVNTNDTGTYECQVSVRGKESELINTINLKVEDSGQTSGRDEDGNMRGHVGLIVGLTGVIVAAAAVVFILMIYRRERNHLPPHPPSIC
ncbi:uncharacterized protein LOC122974278 [Scomber scombrus]|uniref:Uncharacterized protein LOC122974278 n=1 Tax=Scomber scombrus TaxID=13677 RepID=A0AAV1Q5J4_SCOSC